MVERGNERIEHLNPDEREKKALLDISVSGAAFVHPKELKNGTKLVAKIKEHSLNAIVVYNQGRAEGYRIGVKFLSVSLAVQKDLDAFVDEFSRGVPLFCEIIEGEKK
jgi:c-di-GMP-binding flagellar brake protein YcgR